jgi:hypothetical protein
MVQIDGQGFYSPEGDIILELPAIDDEEEKAAPATSNLLSPASLKKDGKA